MRIKEGPVVKDVGEGKGWKEKAINMISEMGKKHIRHDRARQRKGRGKLED